MIKFKKTQHFTMTAILDGVIAKENSNK